MQEFAIQAEEAVDDEDASGTLVSYLDSLLQIQISEHSTQDSIPFVRRSNMKDIDCKIKNRLCRMRHGNGIISIN